MNEEYDDSTLPEDLTEYGYGFWIRFLTRYPVDMWHGKRAPWYILSRMTKSDKPGDTGGLGARTLAIWQGNGYYHFTTFHINGTKNIVRNIN